MQIANVYKYLKNDIQDVEERLAGIIAADHPILHKASLQLLRAGGKRIRPVFALLSAQFGDFDKYEEDIKSVAVALELIHMASLVHDDVVDDSDLRRGKPTVKHMYDIKTATYTGDYILACALEQMSTIHNANIHKVFSESLVKVVEGEIIQLQDKFNLDQNIRQYLRRIKRKTALLIATSCQLGAMVSGAPKRDVNKLFKYGYNVGMSFQIIDDILDFTASEKELGKPTGHDLLQGNLTLPVLYAMNNEQFEQELKQTFQFPALITNEKIESVVSLMQQTNAVEQSYYLSNLYLNKAFESLDTLENIKAKDTLTIIANLLGKRRS